MANLCIFCKFAFASEGIIIEYCREVANDLGLKTAQKPGEPGKKLGDQEILLRGKEKKKEKKIAYDDGNKKHKFSFNSTYVNSERVKDDEKRVANYQCSSCELR